jgi:hypothetical protein
MHLAASGAPAAGKRRAVNPVHIAEFFPVSVLTGRQIIDITEVGGVEWWLPETCAHALLCSTFRSKDIAHWAQFIPEPELRQRKRGTEGHGWRGQGGIRTWIGFFPYEPSLGGLPLSTLT